jgi:hypothetical protein
VFPRLLPPTSLPLPILHPNFTLSVAWFDHLSSDRCSLEAL